jgi:uncharacterized ParB-like nuclease family protein
MKLIRQSAENPDFEKLDEMLNTMQGCLDNLVCSALSREGLWAGNPVALQEWRLRK